MAGPINGSQVVIYVDNGSSGFVAVAYQRNVSFDNKRKLIDTSNKTSGQESTYLNGRLDRDVKLSMLFSDNYTYNLLVAAFDNGETVRVARYFTTDTQPDEGSSFDEVKEADALITDLGEKFGDQEAGMVDVSFKITGGWQDPA